MVSITRASESDGGLLSAIAKTTFIESHGTSAEQADIDSYITEKYSDAVLRHELADAENVYYIIYHNNKVAGYSKIVFNLAYAGSPVQNIAKLERLYLLKEFYNTRLGLALFQFNIDLAKANTQAGVWLYVWKENTRAVNFYTNAGFLIIGSHDFRISATHTNPNHQMFLKC
jgi:ribosomal protein S18 acetylase RimI-like enzyme